MSLPRPSSRLKAEASVFFLLTWLSFHSPAWAAEPAKEKDSENQEVKTEAKPSSVGLLQRIFVRRNVAVSIDFLKMESTENSSLNGTGPGQGNAVSVTSSTGNNHFEVLGRVKYSLREGTARLDGSTSIQNYPFVLSSGEAEIGFNINLFHGLEMGLQPYVGITYGIGLAHLSMTGTPNVDTEITGSSVGLLYGPQMHVGVTILDHLLLEAKLQQTASKIGQLPKLSVGGGSFSIGYKW